MAGLAVIFAWISACAARSTTGCLVDFAAATEFLPPARRVRLCVLCLRYVAAARKRELDTAQQSRRCLSFADLDHGFLPAACDAVRMPPQGIDRGLRPAGKAEVPVGGGLFGIGKNWHIVRNPENVFFSDVPGPPECGSVQTLRAQTTNVSGEGVCGRETPVLAGTPKQIAALCRG